MENIRFFTKNNCAKCGFSKMFLNNKGIKYTEINIDEDESAKEELMSKGYQSLPVIDFGTEVIVGNDPAKLNQILSTVTA
ncbi:glutaredoxin family protein [Staphylococcus phage vB_StaM_SA1]|nr:glutaredoxin family protein [Staphylococcus phage vB_StaM_SA1]